MNRYVKGAMIFTGGVAVGYVVGTIGMFAKMVDNDIIRSAMSSELANKIDKLLYDYEPKQRNRNKASYRSYYNEKIARRSYDGSILDIVFATRKNAEDALRQMLAILDKYGVVTVADYYDIAGINAHYIINKLGWTKRMDIVGATIAPVRDGYTIKLPEPKEIE